MLHHLAAELGERFGLGARAVPDRHVKAGLDQPFGHGGPHAPRPNPTDLVLLILTVRRHCMLLAKLQIPLPVLSQDGNAVRAARTAR